MSRTHSAHHKDFSSLRDAEAINGRNEQARANTDAEIGSANLLKALERYFNNRARERRARA